MFPTNQTLNSNRNRVALILSALCCTAVVASLTDSVRPVSAQSAGPSWSYTGRLNEPRVAPVATQLQDGRVLIAGGFGMDDDITKSVELYNPNTGAWSPTGNLVSADGGINLTVLTDGKVLAVGYSGTELYDPSASTWIKISDPNLTFSGHKEVLLLNGKVLMVGGYQSELFDPSTGLNQFSGNYIQAEMIKAFLSSTEYRRRFGP